MHKRYIFWLGIFFGSNLIYADSPYAPQSVGLQASGSEIGSYTYDRAGNRLVKKTADPDLKPDNPDIYAQTYKVGLIGKVVNIEQNGVTTSIKHGSGGRRYMRVDNNGGDQSKTFYFPGMEYKITADDIAITTVQIHVKGYSPVAQVEIKNGSANQTYRYLVQDHLGSPVTSVGDTGSAQELYRYDAWGQITKPSGVAQAPTEDDEKTGRYTGHELMAKFNLGQWNYRIFDYQIGAFPQPDIFIQGTSIPALNRYALGQHKNPNITDPSGLQLRFRSGGPPGASRRGLNFLENQLTEHFSEGQVLARLNNETRPVNRSILDSQLREARRPHPDIPWVNTVELRPNPNTTPGTVTLLPSAVLFQSTLRLGINPEDITALRSRRRNAAGVMRREETSATLVAQVDRRLRHLFSTDPNVSTMPNIMTSGLVGRIEDGPLTNGQLSAPQWQHFHADPNNALFRGLVNTMRQLGYFETVPVQHLLHVREWSRDVILWHSTAQSGFQLPALAEIARNERRAAYADIEN